jgi:hypothetical protein
MGTTPHRQTKSMIERTNEEKVQYYDEPFDNNKLTATLQGRPPVHKITP